MSVSDKTESTIWSWLYVVALFSHFSILLWWGRCPQDLMTNLSALVNIPHPIDNIRHGQNILVNLLMYFSLRCILRIRRLIYPILYVFYDVNNSYIVFISLVYLFILSRVWLNFSRIRESELTRIDLINRMVSQINIHCKNND